MKLVASSDTNRGDLSIPSVLFSVHFTVEGLEKLRAGCSSEIVIGASS